MKTKTILILISMTIVISSCLVKSLHPFYKEKDIVFNPELVGTFMDQDTSMWEFSRLNYSRFLNGDTVTNSYKVKYVSEDGDSSFLIGTLFRLKDDYYVDFYPLDNKQDESLADWHWIPAHSLAKIYIWGKDNATFFWYDEDWLNKLFENKRIKISHEVIQTSVSTSDKTYILTASTSDLQKFIRKYGDTQDILKNIDQRKIRDNDDRNFVFTFINDYLANKGEKNFIGGNDLMVINLKRSK